MRRGYLLLCAVMLVGPAVLADGNDDLREEVRRLRQEVGANRSQIQSQQETIDALQAAKTAALREEIASYLEDGPSLASAQGASPLEGLTIQAGWVGVLQSSVGNTPADRLVGDGTLLLNFEMQVTEDLQGFAHFVANTGPSGNPTAFGSISPANGQGPWGPIGAPTATGIFDGVGIDGTQSFNDSPIDIYQAGIRHKTQLGDTVLNWELGGLDPRTRFSQSAFADDENTQFLSNTFDDSPAVNWITTSPRGTSVFGLHMWVDVGADKNFRVSWGWFNSVAQVLNNGQLYFQVHWSGEMNGRAMNLRAFGFLDAYTEAAAGEDVAGGGVSWDWLATDTIGVFVRISANGGDFNPVDLDASVGAVLTGIADSRPDDSFGIAIGYISLQTVLVGPLSGFSPAEDTEVTVEIYYRYVTENGKLQVTPHIMYIKDPAGGVGWTDDSLWILGLRFYVPF